MKVSALIQVRMKSQRLPGKALIPLNGMPVIEYVIRSLRGSRFLDDVVICTTVEKEDDALETFAITNGYSLYRGEVDNVISRFYGAAKKSGCDVIVRIAGDCPAVSADAVDFLLEQHLASGADYTSVVPATAPIGSFPQVFSFQALDRLTRYPLDFSLSEYMLYYFTNNPGVFSLNTASAPIEYHRPEYRLTLDYWEDLEMFESLFRKLLEDGLTFSLKNIVVTLDRHPWIGRINAHLIPKYQGIYDALMENIHRATTVVMPSSGTTMP